MPSPPSEGQSRQGMRCGLGRDGFHRKCGADIGSRVDKEAAVGRPRRINRVFADKRKRVSDHRWARGRGVERRDRRPPR